jgi:hypothetical protein
MPQPPGLVTAYVHAVSAKNLRPQGRVSSISWRREFLRSKILLRQSYVLQHVIFQSLFPSFKLATDPVLMPSDTYGPEVIPPADLELPDAQGAGQALDNPSHKEDMMKSLFISSGPTA